jgi:starch-binding outer membrane protein, SusD/RagB family
MKKIFNILLAFASISLISVSCTDILDVKSNRITYENDYRMSSPNDTVYAMEGIWSQLRNIADSYVLLGELRGDLLDVTENSNINLREISNFEISKENPYAQIKDYYAVINNCNYVIQHIDTSYTSHGQKVMKGFVASVKSIRAWTYMQIALNFGSVKYYVLPILNQADADAVNNYPDISMNELADLLIADLTPWEHETLSQFLWAKSFPVHFVLGDLYLWKGEGFYDKAATEYHALMVADRYGINFYQSAWNVKNKVISTSSGFTTDWIKSFTAGYGETITKIYCPKGFGKQFNLDSLNYNNQFAPSAVSIKNWDTQIYHNTPLDYMPGDLRKFGSIIAKNDVKIDNSGNITSYIYPTSTFSKPIIKKYLTYDQNVLVYRSSLLYLRYAEAVNRLGKPNLAFAVLKNGLRSATMSTPSIIPLNEKTTEEYMNFNDRQFEYNVGIRWRGLGPKLKDTNFAVLTLGDCDSTFVIKQQANLNDSIVYVEDLIQKELALETAFEGNRFHDLMRIAIRRNNPDYLAEIVSEKHPNNKVAIREKLKQPENWYLKK